MGTTKEVTRRKGYDYGTWFRGTALSAEAEPPEANPDVLEAAETRDATAGEEVVRDILDNKGAWLRFTGEERLVFYAAFVERQPYRIIGRIIGKTSTRSVHRVILRIREKIREEITRREGDR